MTRARPLIEQLLRARAAAHPDEIWLRWEDSTFRWHEVISTIQRAANGWLELGVRPGDRVAIMVGNCPEFIWAYFGLLFIGAGPVPVNTAQRGATLEHILSHSGVTAIIADADLAGPLAAVRGGCPELRRSVAVGGKASSGAGGSSGGPGGTFDWTAERLLSAPDVEPDVAVDSPSSGASMLYTSGTTGPPKGVVTSQYDAGPISEVLRSTGVQPGETMYTALPLFHGNALFVSMTGSILLDARLALGKRFSGSRMFDECRRHEAVEVNTLGGMISILLKQPPRPDDADNPVRVVLSAGCPPDRWEAFEQRYGVRIIEWFGMVDAPGVLLNDVSRIGSMGKPVGGVEFLVVDDAGRALGPGKVGELVFRHPLGQLTYYHGSPEATDQAYRDGWFHSGDLASYDEEGFFYYRGRKKESIRRLGENISAWEIETAVNAHPQVQESAAHAVVSELGEDEVKLVVVPKAGEHIDPQALVDYCVGKMAAYAVPRYVEVVDALPKTGTHRIRYSELKGRGVTSATWDRAGAAAKR